jgi:enhancer of mRNA-decapping protein 4
MWTQMLFQDGIRAGFETLIIPAFERSCQTMFDQVNTAFQTEMIEHSSQVQRELASTHTALATNLQVSKQSFCIDFLRNHLE